MRTAISQLRRLRLPALAAALAAFTAGCTELGIDGELAFADTTTGAVRLDERALAVGADMVVQVFCSKCAGTPSLQASSLNEDVLQIVGVAGDTVRVRGLRAGTAMLRVTADQYSDAIPIDVAAPATATVRMLPWSELAALPPELWEGGFAMLPDTSIEVRAFPRTAAAGDTEGERLTGFGAVSWSISDAAGRLEIDSERRADIVRVFADGEAGSAFVVEPSVGPEKPIAIVGEDEIAELKLYVARDTDFLLGEGDVLELSAGSGAILHLVALTDDGVYIHGAGSSFATFTLSEGLAPVVRDDLAQLAEGEDEDDLRRTFARGYLWTADAPATGTAQFEWLGKTLNVAVQVEAAQ